MPSPPTFEWTPGSLPIIDAVSAIEWTGWLEANDKTMNWFEVWPKGKPSIMTLFIIEDDDFVWLHSMPLGPNGKVAMCDRFFGGIDISDIYDLEDMGKVAIAPFITIEDNWG